jgi:hypothetical protein
MYQSSRYVCVLVGSAVKLPLYIKTPPDSKRLPAFFIASADKARLHDCMIA